MNDENNHNIYRKIIYESAKKLENTEKLLPFFISNEEQEDEIILNKNFDSYI